MDMGWVNPWVGLDWVGSVGLGPKDDELLRCGLQAGMQAHVY